MQSPVRHTTASLCFHPLPPSSAPHPQEKKRNLKLNAAPTEAQRDKWRAAAAKRGFYVGARVEAPLMGGGGESEFDGSWYAPRSRPASYLGEVG